ncbi:MAG: methylmalonyl Co-A mutase-associated GTPase MeaB, partial [Odoribacter sp.]|nr:methylmalonyl Co-A mutase-associated GTPase MeaB [Odoribacter sp.]
VDLFMLLQISGAGDELQGIKRGIMEMADSIIINKADGNNIQRAELAKAQLQTALHFFPSHESGVMPKVMTCSAYERTGIDSIWEHILHYCSETQQNGYFEYRRAEQAKYWMYETINEQLRNRFYQNQKDNLKKAEEEVMQNKVSSFAAAFDLLNRYFQQDEDKTV